MYNTPTTTCAVNYWRNPLTIIKRVSAQNIITASCQAFKVSKVDLLSKCKKKELVRARAICIFIIDQRLKMKPKGIAQLFNRDRTTALHAIQTIKDDLSIPAYRQRTIEEIRAVSEFL